MPSYADEMAERMLQRSTHSGPVRIEISRGELVQDAKGNWVHSERWTTEEGMDTDESVIESIDKQDDVQFSPLKDASSSLSSYLGQNMRRAAPSGRMPQGGSLLVLDTNTLLSSLPVCTEIFNQTLALNVLAMNSASFLASPVMLIVPNIVVRELDNLKSKTSKESIHASVTIGQKAQRANRWLLQALQEQKKRSYTTGDGQSSVIPEDAWVLHIESSEFYRNSRHDPSYRDDSPDDEIISHCRALQRDTQQTVWLCSDDVNAKLRAESDSILTFSMADWTREQLVNDRADRRGEHSEGLAKAVSGLIEQWRSQMGLAPGAPTYVHSSSTAMVGSPVISSVPMEEVVSTQSVRAPVTRKAEGIASSVYAHDHYSNRSSWNNFERSSSHSPTRSKQSPEHLYKRHFSKKEVDDQYTYPSDRSSSSSRWAAR